MQNVQTLLNQWKKKNYRSLLKIFNKIAQSNPQNEVPLPMPSALSLEGGGQRGKVYISAIEALEQLGIIGNLKVVVGTSIGAVFAFVIGLGFSAAKIRQIGDNFNFTDLLDMRKSRFGHWWAGTWFNKASALIVDEYIHNGNIFYNWAAYVTEKVLGDPHASFADLHEKIISGEDPSLKEMIFTAVDAKEDTFQEFSFEKTPDIRIVDALQASLSIPGIFPVKIVRNKEGKEFGRFVDGGVRMSNPVNILDKTNYVHPNYPLQTQTNSNGIAINPSALGLSLNWSHLLDKSITPIAESIKREIRALQAEHPIYYILQKKIFSLWEWSKQKKSQVAQVLQHYKYKYWRFYDLGDILRHAWHFNFGPLALNKEDGHAKQLAHVPNAIQFWNLDISPHEIKFTQKQKERTQFVGKETVLNWWDQLHRPSEVYKGHYVDLKSDYELDKLPSYLIEMDDEIKKYQQPELFAHGYEPGVKNVKLIALCKKVNSILVSTTTPLSVLRNAFKQAEKHQQEKQEKIESQQYKRDCFSDAYVTKNLNEIVERADCEQLVRAYHSQLGNGLQLLLKSTFNGKNAIQRMMEKNSADMLEVALNLVANTFNQAVQNGIKLEVASIEEWLKLACRPDDFINMPNRNSAQVIGVIRKFFPAWMNYAINHPLPPTLLR